MSAVIETNPVQSPVPATPAATNKAPKGLIAFGVAAFTTLVALMGYHIGNMERLDRDYFKPQSAVAAARGSAGGGVVVAGAGNAQHGQSLFSATCFACHGPQGDGVPNVGPTLRTSKFVASNSDDQLISFIKVGRLPGQPGSVMNGMMPAKGGNPALDDASLRDIVSFLRELQSNRADAGTTAGPLANLTTTR